MQVHNDDSHISTPLIDLQMGRLENFLIVCHEAGGVGKRHMKALPRGGLYTRKNCVKTTGIQSHIRTLRFHDTKNRYSGTSQLGVHRDNLIALARNYLSKGNFKSKY
jgi:hypothetical protein